MLMALLIEDVWDYVREAQEFDFDSPFSQVVGGTTALTVEEVIESALRTQQLAATDVAAFRAWYLEFERIRGDFLLRTGRWLQYVDVGDVALLCEARLPLVDEQDGSELGESEL